jgi:OOP family OmpA-OmpF porin
VADSAAARQGDVPGAPRVTSAEEFAELRSLLVGPEQRHLRTLQARLDDKGAQTRDVSRVLPQAILLRKDDPQMTRALAPTVEEALTASVRRDPRPLADALFPIFGPAIRKAIAASLSTMLESMNRTLEHSLSWRAVRWRITALRTGKSFAEVVLLDTLVYRVEQVLLIERESGLLLQHLSAPGVGAQDADMVSGMLTAIRDFARDSFKVPEGDTLDRLQVGELSVWIEQGPHAILAAVIRGNAPPELRVTMLEALEHVHAKLGDTLASFNGDAAPFDAVRPVLDTCLQARYRGGDKKVSVALRVVAAALVLALVTWAAFALIARSRWNSFIAALRAEPGVVVVSEHRRWSGFEVSGLRDPLSVDPTSLLSGAGLAPDDVTQHWQMYQALEPALIVARARQLLRTPDSVTLQYADGVLTAGGTAPLPWIVESQRIATLVPGVVRYDAAALLEGEVRRRAEELEATPLLFVRGTTAFEAGGDAVLATHIENIRALDSIAQASGARFTIEITGHADSDGPPSTNDVLSSQRADRVRAALAQLGVRHIDLSATGVGSSQPLQSRALTETDQRANRRVSLRLIPQGR